MLYRIAIFSKYRDTSIYRYVSHITNTYVYALNIRARTQAHTLTCTHGTHIHINAYGVI